MAERGLSSDNTACPMLKPKRLPNNQFQGICQYMMKMLAPICSFVCGCRWVNEKLSPCISCQAGLSGGSWYIKCKNVT